MFKNSLIILFSLFSFVFTGCYFSKPKIVIWEYNENLENEIFNAKKLSELPADVCKQGLSISFSNFNEFDNVRKIFNFKSKSDAEIIQKKVWQITSRDDCNYFFSIVQNDNLLSSGYFIPSVNYSAYQGKSEKRLKMFFTHDYNLRIALDATLQNFEDEIELINTKEIETFLPVKYKKMNSDVISYKEGDKNIIYLNHEQFLVDIYLNENSVENLSISDVYTKFSESYSDSDNLIQHYISTKDYSETTFVCKDQSSSDHPAVRKTIILDNGIEIELDIFADGRVVSKTINSGK